MERNLGLSEEEIAIFSNSLTKIINSVENNPEIFKMMNEEFPKEPMAPRGITV